MHTNMEDRIRALAYQLWEADGRPEGNAEFYWHRAATDCIEVVATKNPVRRAKLTKVAKAPAVAEPVTKRRRASKAD